MFRSADENVKYGWIYQGGVEDLSRMKSSENQLYYLYSTNSSIIRNFVWKYFSTRIDTFSFYSSYFYPRIFDITFEIFIIYTRCSILMILFDSFILHGYCSISLVSPFGFLTNYLIIPFIIFILLLINFYLFIYLFFFSISRLFYWYYSPRILFMSVINLRQIPFIYLYQFHSLSF